jgi:hypothetical protein
MKSGGSADRPQSTPDGRRYVDRLVSAAAVFTHLRTIGPQKPDSERQVRPLIGLTPEQAQLVWNRAVDKAAGRQVSERLVRAALREIQGAQPAPAVTQPRRVSKADKHKVLDVKFGELLALLSQKADHTLLTQKVEELHAQIRALFPRRQTKGKQ